MTFVKSSKIIELKVKWHIQRLFVAKYRFFVILSEESLA